LIQDDYSAGFYRLTVERKVVFIRVKDPELWRKAKAQAALEGVPLNHWIEDIIRLRLEINH